MKKMSGEEAKRWYGENRPHYENLNALVRGTIESLLRKADIGVLSVSGRAKAIESFAEKIDRKGYDNPTQQMTDLCGIRVITFIEEDVDRVCEVIKRSFNVHSDKSLNKSDELEVDRFGYRSVHFVCDLGKKRTGLPEYELYNNMLFEIQVRTVLQHAWAEIEHDRSYKFSGALPSALKRRFHLVAGMLELADREFNSIAQELETYSKEVAEKTKKGDLDVELNTTSALNYLSTHILDDKAVDITPELYPSVIEELKSFGIKSLADLEKILSSDFWHSVNQFKPGQNSYYGILRIAMMFEDLPRYFKEAWKEDWFNLSSSSCELLIAKYGQELVQEIAARYGIRYAGKKP